MSQDESNVKVKTLVVETQETVEIEGDLLIAADGCLSSIRKTFLPDFKLRYSGYCAWRGVFDFSGNENSETVSGIKKVYPDLGKCLYFDNLWQHYKSCQKIEKIFIFCDKFGEN